MEKEVILGALESGPNKDKSDVWYRVNYLDLTSGRACQDYFENPADFKKLADLKIPIGTKIIGLFTGNSRRMLVLYSVKK